MSERTMEGTAYAVLTNEDDPRGKGNLVFLRSNHAYEDGPGQTVTDVMGNAYVGHVFTGIEDGGNPRRNQWANADYNYKKAVLTSYVADGQAVAPSDLAYWFAECVNMTRCDVSGLMASKSTSAMFDSCERLTDLDISGWDTSRVTNMRGMFLECWNLVHIILNMTGGTARRRPLTGGGR